MLSLSSIKPFPLFSPRSPCSPWFFSHNHGLEFGYQTYSPFKGLNLAERRRERFEHFGPSSLCAARVIGPLRVHFMSQGGFDPCLLRNYFDDHKTFVRRLPSDAPREDQSPGPVNFPILPDMIDLLALTAHKEREGPSHSRVGDNAQDLLFAESGAEHPFADQFWIEPCVENALRRRVEMAGDADFDIRRRSSIFAHRLVLFVSFIRFRAHRDRPFFLELLPAAIFLRSSARAFSSCPFSACKMTASASSRAVQTAR